MEENHLRQLLDFSLSRGGSFADLFIEETDATSIICEEDKIEQILTGSDRGAGIRLIHDLQTYYASSADLSPSTLEDLALSLANAVPAHTPIRSSPSLSLDAQVPPWSHPIRIPPRQIPLKEKVKRVMAANAVARAIDPSIRQVRVICREGWRRTRIANSEGHLCEEDRVGLLFMVQVVASKDHVIQTGYEVIGGVVGWEIFEEHPAEAVAEKAARRALQMLQADPAPAGPMMVVVSSEAGGTMIHEAVGHGLESDLAQDGLSVYSHRLGEQIASPLITVIDDPTLPGRRGSYVFDDEGTLAQKTILVEHGILKGYLYDRLAAFKDQTRSTGNGRRQSYQHKPIPRMSNTLIAPGQTPPEEIIRSVSKGLLVKKMGGGQVNTVNGDFVFEVSEGYRIEGGEVGPPVRGATLTGNGPRILQQIDRVGSDLGFSLGTCGKDGQGAPVSDAQPTLRIPEIIVGGTSA